MRVLFDDGVPLATLTALHADAAYPVTNIQHPFLKKIFKSTEATDTIAINFGAERSFDSCYIGLTNATSISVAFYDDAHTLITTKSIPAATLCSVFARVDGAQYAEFTMANGAADLYVGAIALGLGYVMPDPRAQWKRGQIDTSIRQESDGGQFQTSKIPWRRHYQFEFTITTESIWTAIYALMSAVDRPIWVDPFELNRTLALPVYAAVAGTFDEPREEGGVYRIALDVREVF